MGLSYSKISTELHLSKQTLIAWQKKLKEEIENERNLLIQKILEEYRISEDERLRNYAELRRRLQQELEQRDFADTSIKDIFYMIKRLDKHFEGLEEKIDLKTREEMNEIKNVRGIDSSYIENHIEIQNEEQSE